MPIGSFDDDRQLPISLVAHQVFCPRRAWLEAAGENTDTFQMAAGDHAHKAVDGAASSRPGRLTAINVASAELGLTGRCDSVEVADDGALTVIEHKVTPVRRTPTITAAMRIQLALQVIALVEAGHRVAGQAVYFSNHNTKVDVDLDEEDLAQARVAVEQTRRTLESTVAPPVLEDDPRCGRCSHVDVCLPDERALEPVQRRIVASDPETQVLHLSTPGSRASISRGRIVVKKGDERIGSVPIERVQGMVVHGNVDLSGALIRELLWRSLPIVWATSRGRTVGWARSAKGPNGSARPRQHIASHQGRIDLARQFVSAKIGNQATLLRRLGNAPEVVQRLREDSRRAQIAESVADLFGIEGAAAARYFDSFSTMLNNDVLDNHGLRSVTRTRRPANDAMNAALNFTYGLLTGDLISACSACGLDPHAGFLHSSNRNKPALALDLAEEFRAVVADSVVIAAFNNGELKPHDFSTTLGSFSLRQSGRRSLLAAYERRVQTEFQHPTFQYRVTWRRAMEIQARLILGVIDGTQPGYVGIRVR